jgi:hypothetical protein
VIIRTGLQKYYHFVGLFRLLKVNHEDFRRGKRPGHRDELFARRREHQPGCHE